MGDVIQGDFIGPELTTGYLYKDDVCKGLVQGRLAAVSKDDGVFVGYHEGKVIIVPAKLSMEEMNDFCFYWLIEYDPDIFPEAEDPKEILMVPYIYAMCAGAAITGAAIFTSSLIFF